MISPPLPVCHDPGTLELYLVGVECLSMWVYVMGALRVPHTWHKKATGCGVAEQSLLWALQWRLMLSDCGMSGVSAVSFFEAVQILFLVGIVPIVTSDVGQMLPVQ